MKEPIVRGTIEQRLVSCYTCELGLVADYLPSTVSPLERAGQAIAMVSLDWWRDVRLGPFPPFPSLAFPNLGGRSPARARHTVAIERREDGRTRCGTWPLRVDTSSPIGAWLDGGWLRGTLRRARIELELDELRFRAAMTSHDDRIRFEMFGHRTSTPDNSSLFETVTAFGRFIESTDDTDRSEHDLRDANGSPSDRPLRWEALTIDRASATLFDRDELFPSGALTLDSAFLGSRDVPSRALDRRGELAVGGIQPTLQPAP